MNSVDVLMQTSDACSVHIQNPYLAVAWLEALIGAITPTDYLSIFQHLNPMNPDALDNARRWVHICFGTPA